MRIVMVTPFAGDAFGQERAVAETSRLLRSDGHSVGVVYDHLNGSLPAFDSALEVKGLSSFHPFSPPWKVASAHRRILKYLDAQAPDVVHLHDLFDARLVRALSARYPIVFTAHTVAATCPSSARSIAGGGACTKKSGLSCIRHNAAYGCLGSLKTDAHRLHAIHGYVTKRGALRKKVGTVFAISPYVKRAMVQDGWDGERIEVVYNSVSVSAVSPLVEVPKNLIVFAARIERLKGLRTLVEALPKVTARATLWVCGDGGERKELQALCLQMGIANRVRFLGRTPADFTARVMASASVVVAPNQGPEAFGLSVAEATLLGVPVITSAVPALNESFSEGRGLVFAVGDASALANALNAVLDNPLNAGQRAEKARLWMSERCDPKRHLEQTLRGYERVLKEWVSSPSWPQPAREPA